MDMTCERNFQRSNKVFFLFSIKTSLEASGLLGQNKVNFQAES